MTSPSPVPINPWYAGQQPGDFDVLGEALSHIAQQQQAQQQAQMAMALEQQKLDLEREQQKTSQGYLKLQMEQLKQSQRQGETEERVGREAGGALRDTQTPSRKRTGDLSAAGGLPFEVQTPASDAEAFASVSPEAAPALQELLGKRPKPEQVKAEKETQHIQDFKEYQRLKQTDAQAAREFGLMTGIIKPPKDPGQPESDEFTKEGLKARAKALIDQRGKTVTAIKAIGQTREAARLVGKVNLGLGATAVLHANRLLGKAGLSVGGQQATDLQTLMNLMNRETLALLQTRVLGSGTGISKSDVEFAQNTSGANASLEPNTIRNILRLSTLVRLDDLNKYRDELERLREERPGDVTTYKITGLDKDIEEANRLVAELEKQIDFKAFPEYQESEQERRGLGFPMKEKPNGNQ